jgi:lysylphosphatidylglycerol synthase-like protein
MLRVVLLLGGAALLVLLLWRLGPSEVLDAFGQVGWYFVLALLLGAAHQATRALALHACVLRRRVLRYRDALAIRLSGEAIQSLTLTGPLLAEPTKAWLLETRGLTLKEGFAATITEYLIYTFVTAVMAITGLTYLIVEFDPSPTVRRIAVAMVSLCAVFLLVSAMAIARRYYLIGTIIDALARMGILRGRLKPDMTWINQMEDLLLIVFRDSPGRFAKVAVLETAAQGLLVLELFLLLHGLHVSASGWSAFVIEASLKFFEFAFLFVPLQLGVSEGSYALVFGVMGLPLAAGFALAFLRRARSLIIATVGLGTLGVMTRRVAGQRLVDSSRPRDSLS